MFGLSGMYLYYSMEEAMEVVRWIYGISSQAGGNLVTM